MKAHLRNRFDFGLQFLLDSVQRITILVRDQIDGDTQMTESTRSTDSVQISFGISWKIEIDHHIHRLDVDTSSQQI